MKIEVPRKLNQTPGKCENKEKAYSQQLEHMQAQDRTVPGIRNIKCLLSACHNLGKSSMETSIIWKGQIRLRGQVHCLGHELPS